MGHAKVTKQYRECGHSYVCNLEDLQDPEEHVEECPICRVVIVDPQEDFFIHE